MKAIPVNLSAVDRLFYRMKERYGSNWCMKFTDESDRMDAKLDWYRDLKRYNVDDVKRALDKLDEKYPQQPPELEQFVELCAPAKPKKASQLTRPGYRTLHIEPVKVADRATGAAEMRKMRELGILRHG